VNTVGASSRTFLVFLLHPGYLRPYLPVVEELVHRGHRVHIAFSEPARLPADRRLEERAATLEGVSLASAPRRGRLDGWRGIALAARLVADAARYADPRFSTAPALRERAQAKAEMRLRAGGPLDPLTRRALTRLLRTIGRLTSEAASRRLVAGAWLVDSAVPPSRRIVRFLRGISPDVVVVSPLVEIGSSQVEYLKSARDLGIPTVVAVASWDNLTNKGLLRFTPDRVVVWNDAQRREAVELHGVPDERVVVTGAQRFDEWFVRKPAASRAAVATHAGLDPDEPFFLYVCSSSFIAPNEVPFVERWLAQLRGEPALARVGVIVRPHPKHATPWRDVDLGRFGNVSVQPREGAEPDESTARRTYFDTLARTTAVVGVNTSVLVEAAILRKPVLGLVTDDFARTQTGTLHFNHLVGGADGFLQIATSFEEHLVQLRRTLDAPDGYASTAERFVGSFLRPHGLDIPATPLVADAFAAAELTRQRAAPRAVRVPLRGLLQVPALLGTVSALVELARGRAVDEPREDA
jgi:hypothetical protein